MDLAVSQISTYKVIKPSGKIDWESARELDKQIQATIDAGYSHIVFNLNDVSFLCSGAIGALVYNLNKIKKVDGAIYIISNNEYVNYIFETLKFDIVFDGLIFDSFERFQQEVIDRE